MAPSTPNPLALDDLRLFCRIAQLGSLSAVARERHVPVSQISRLLKRIETAYSVRLVHRSTHGLSLTPEGKRFHESAVRITAELDELDTELHGQTQSVSGLVRVAMSALVAEHLIVPSLQALLAQHPLVRIDLRVEDRVVDMAREGIDIAIRTGEPTSDLWVLRSLGKLSRRLYASPAYVARQGLPDSVQALSQHQLINHSAHPALNRWKLEREDIQHSVSAQGALMADNSATQAAMALAGLGVARMVSMVGEPLVAQGRLVPVLPEWHGPDRMPVSAVMLAERHRLPKVRACVDYWVAWFAERSGA